MQTKKIIIVILIIVVALAALFHLAPAKARAIIGFQDDSVSPEDKVYNLKRWIRTSPDPGAINWKAQIQARAEEYNQNFEERLHEEVLFSLNQQGH